MTVKNGKILDETFRTNSGVPQEASLSSKRIILYLQQALDDVDRMRKSPEETENNCRWGQTLHAQNTPMWTLSARMMKTLKILSKL